MLLSKVVAAVSVCGILASKHAVSQFIRSVLFVVACLSIIIFAHVISCSPKSTLSHILLTIRQPSVMPIMPTSFSQSIIEKFG
jgi:hypothetical protein